MFVSRDNAGGGGGGGGGGGPAAAGELTDALRAQWLLPTLLSTLRQHAGTDLLAGSWAFAGFMCACCAFGAADAVLEPSALASLFFASQLPFAAGALLLARASYPGALNRPAPGELWRLLEALGAATRAKGDEERRRVGTQLGRREEGGLLEEARERVMDEMVARGVARGVVNDDLPGVFVERMAEENKASATDVRASSFVDQSMESQNDGGLGALLARARRSVVPGASFVQLSNLGSELLPAPLQFLSQKEAALGALAWATDERGFTAGLIVGSLLCLPLRSSRALPFGFPLRALPLAVAVALDAVT
jgi:hypothetical protein